MVEKGVDDLGRPWLCGEISLGKSTVYIDTRAGTGQGTVLKHLKNFISYEASKISFPTMTTEDVIQELNVLALEAIPQYCEGRGANLLTFLQGHVKKRIINKHKFVSEKKRQATHCSVPYLKVRCPNCKAHTIAESGHATCHSCGTTTATGIKWKHYNIPVVAVPFSMIEKKLSEDSPNLNDMLPAYQTFAFLAGDNHYSLEDEVRYKLDFQKFYAKMDDRNRTIVGLLLEGHSHRDIANKIGIPEKDVIARISKILSKCKT
jgi:DNA-directed RNA polymerase specialized sigma24 family protein